MYPHRWLTVWSAQLARRFEEHNLLLHFSMYRLSTDGRSDSTIDWDWVDMEPSWLVVVFGFTFRMICIRGWFWVSVWVRLLASMLVWLHTYTYCYFIAGIFRYFSSMPRGIWLFVPSLLSPVTTCMYDWLSVCEEEARKLSLVGG